MRIGLYEELAYGGAMTATELGKRIGETATTCSFHLRQLAKYGFVEEAGGGKGRARPWRLTALGWDIPVAHDPETQVAGDAVLRLSRERAFARYQRWQETKAAHPRDWQEAADDSEYVTYLTTEELQQVKQELHAVLERFWERLADRPGARPVPCRWRRCCCPTRLTQLAAACPAGAIRAERLGRPRAERLSSFRTEPK